MECDEEGARVRKAIAFEGFAVALSGPITAEYTEIVAFFDGDSQSAGIGVAVSR